MTRKMAETSRGATVRNVPGTRSEARRSERSVTFVTLGLGSQASKQASLLKSERALC